MSKLKKILLMGATYVAVGAVAIGGTLAYLSDTGSDVNVMTMGNVKIEQNELQRVQEGGEFIAELEDFEQGKTLMPYVSDSTNSPDVVEIGGYEVTLSDYYDNYIDKIVNVTNTGKSDAYVRTLVAVPTGGSAWEPDPVAAADCWLHWNYPKGSTDYWTLNATPALAEINEQGYYVWEFVHKKAISKNESTYPVICGFFMDRRVNNDDNGYYMTYEDGTVKRIDDYQFGDTVDVLVVSQAVQADGFNDALTALDAAFGDITTDNHPWIDGVEIPAVVDNADDLNAALANGESVVLTKDITTPELVVEGDVDVVIDLNGNELSNPDGRALKIDGNADVTIKNGTVNAKTYVAGLFGDAKLYAEGVVFNGKYGFGTNGSMTTENSVAEFVDCEFHMTSAYNVAYISAKGTYTFKDCVMEGGAGVLVRSGNVTLDGCTIIANGYMGKDKVQPLTYVNYETTASGVIADGVSYWNASTAEGSTGDCVVVVDNSGAGFDLKSVTIENCTFKVANTVEVDGEEVATGYAVRYFNKDPSAEAITMTLNNNKDADGNPIQNGTIGCVYSYYPAQ